MKSQEINKGVLAIKEKEKEAKSITEEERSKRERTDGERREEEKWKGLDGDEGGGGLFWCCDGSETAGPRGKHLVHAGDLRQRRCHAEKKGGDKYEHTISLSKVSWLIRQDRR